MNVWVQNSRCLKVSGERLTRWLEAFLWDLLWVKDGHGRRCFLKRESRNKKRIRSSCTGKGKERNDTAVVWWSDADGGRDAREEGGSRDGGGAQTPRLKNLPPACIVSLMAPSQRNRARLHYLAPVSQSLHLHLLLLPPSLHPLLRGGRLLAWHFHNSAPLFTPAMWRGGKHQSYNKENTWSTEHVMHACLCVCYNAFIVKYKMFSPGKGKSE